MAEENAEDSYEVVTNMVNYVNNRDPYWHAANRLKPKQASFGGLSMIDISKSKEKVKLARRFHSITEDVMTARIEARSPSFNAGSPAPSLPSLKGPGFKQSPTSPKDKKA